MDIIYNEKRNREKILTFAPNKEAMTSTSTLYSIGHGQKTPEEFISELRAFGIQFLVDVRTSPFSKWAPQFNRGVIENWLQQSGITYVYMGDCIGGRPNNESCCDSEGYFDYQEMAKEPAFLAGLQRLVNANQKHCKTAIMCSETNPSECHRSKLIGRELYFTFRISVNHIIGPHRLLSQEEIMKYLTSGRWECNATLFGACEPPYFKSRKSYRPAFDITQEPPKPYD